MARPKLDGAGTIKMQTLDDATTTLQSLHGIVEQMAMAVRNETGVGPHTQRLKRAATPLIGQLKGQFGTISDAVTAMLLVATRGASDKTRVRALRESIASIRMQLEAAQRRVQETHMVSEENAPQRGGGPGE